MSSKIRLNSLSLNILALKSCTVYTATPILKKNKFKFFIYKKGLDTLYTLHEGLFK